MSLIQTTPSIGGLFWKEIVPEPSLMPGRPEGGLAAHANGPHAAAAQQAGHLILGQEGGQFLRRGRLPDGADEGGSELMTGFQTE